MNATDAKTWGQLADEGAPLTEAFELVMQLAKRAGQQPVTKGLGPGQCWKRKLPDGWVVYMNGWPDPAEHDGYTVPARHALGVQHGTPLVMFSPFEGSQLGGAGIAEDSLIAAMQQELGIAPTTVGGTDA